MAIESDNAREEIKEIVEGCIKCGLCRSLCPVLRVLKEEQYSPRGKAMILDSGSYEKIVYDCNLCKACEKQCPANIRICDAIIKARGILVRQKKEIFTNHEMIKNIEKTGNIYGIKQKEE